MNKVQLNWHAKQCNDEQCNIILARKTIHEALVIPLLSSRWLSLAFQNIHVQEKYTQYLKEYIFNSFC